MPRSSTSWLPAAWLLCNIHRFMSHICYFLLLRVSFLPTRSRKNWMPLTRSTCWRFIRGRKLRSVSLTIFYNTLTHSSPCLCCLFLLTCCNLLRPLILPIRWIAAPVKEERFVMWCMVNCKISCFPSPSWARLRWTPASWSPRSSSKSQPVSKPALPPLLIMQILNEYFI